MNEQSNSISQQIETLAKTSNLTTGQLLLWLGQKLNPDNPLYNMVFSFTLQGEIYPDHFRRAFQRLIAQCDNLRLTITEVAGVPQQQVTSTLEYDLPFIDFSRETAPHGAAKVWMQGQSTHCLDLESCLFDAALLKLGTNQFIFYFNQHHLITDNWSVSLLYRQLQEDYGQSIQGTLADAAQLPAYGDYAKSVKNQPSSAWQQQAIDHWQQKRATMPPPVALYGHTTPSATTRTERIYVPLGQARSEALRALATTPEARTLSMHQSQFNLFLTLVFAYLYRISGQTELAIAAPVHNRSTPVLKETPGVFMELFPLQVEIGPDETFTSLLGKVAQESMALLRYAQPGVSHHGMDRNVNVVLSYINVTFPEFSGMPVHTDWIHSGYGDSQHHLRLEVHDFDATGNFTLQFDFNQDLIPASQRQWASEHFFQLLDAWLEDGHQQLGTVDILAVEERELLFGSGQRLATANDQSSLTAKRETQDRGVSTLIEQFQHQVDRLPEQVAVIFEDQALTYGELDQRANQWAHYLGHRGIAKGMIVGLFVDRSVAMVVAMLAVLKAGAAYLPIDPTYPPERTNFMVEDAQVSVVLTQQALLEQCPGDQVICLEECQAAMAQQSTKTPEVELTEEDLAYILFTSGSTGTPKGVMVEHRNVLAMLRGFEQTAPAGERRVGAALCSYGFDVSVWEIFSNLCFGGTVHLVPAAVVTDCLATYLVKHAITSAYIPPALLPMVVQSLETVDDPVALDRILVGVEPIQQTLLQRYRHRLPQLRIVNGYGPTETTICATFYSFDTVTEPQGVTPIGKAVPGYGVYLVNPQGQQVPVGVKGEILIGGGGLSRGYLNRPQLTAERFIDNPFGGGKLYKTGDQARYLPDGNLEFLGRLDDQVKIRGFRVELREVEAALSQHPAVQQVVVLAQEVDHGGQALIAYLATAESSLTSGQLRPFLQQKLPDYMVPGRFVVVDQLPLTPNGKVDRRRLATDYAPLENLGAASDYVAPTDGWETYLTQLWAQCLRVETVGVHDNFFDLGGDSITAIQIAAQATETGLALSPQQILNHGTVAAVLAQIGPTQLAQQPGPGEAQIPLTPVQHSFFEQVLVEPHHWNQSLVLSVQPLDPTALEAALQRLIHRHTVLRCQFTLAESGWQQQVLITAAEKVLHRVDLSQQSAASQELAMAKVETRLQTSLNLMTGKLVQAALFDIGNNQPSRLLLIIHHLAVDGVSWLTLLSDLELFYRQVLGETVTQPLPTTSFQRWSSGLATAVSSGAFQSELDYWLTLEQTAVNPLPRDAALPVNGNTVASVQTVTTCLEVEETQQLLKELPKACRGQVNEILLVALASSLGEAGQLLVDVEGHGREETVVPGVNLVRTVGWFTTVYPLLLKLPQASVGEQLQAVKEQVRGVPGRGIGYGLLRYLEGGARSQLQSLPQADVLFNYLGDLEGLVPAGSMFQLARELQLSRSRRGQRRYLLEVNAAVVKGRLRVEWSYCYQVHRQETVQGWADGLIQGVRSQISHFLAPDTQRQSKVTAVDFPLANLDSEKLGKIAALLNKTDREK